MVSLVAKSKDPDPTYGARTRGFVVMNVADAAGVPIDVPGRRYRRRVQTIKINLRNYAFQG